MQYQRNPWSGNIITFCYRRTTDGAGFRGPNMGPTTMTAATTTTYNNNSSFRSEARITCTESSIVPKFKDCERNLRDSLSRVIKIIAMEMNIPRNVPPCLLAFNCCVDELHNVMLVILILALCTKRINTVYHRYKQKENKPA